MDELVDGTNQTYRDMAIRMRQLDPDFAELAELLGEVAAVQAQREESTWIKTALNRQTEAVRVRWPRHRPQIRRYLIDHKLEWTQENLGAAAAAVSPGQLLG